MSLAARSPSARKSLSLQEYNINNLDNVTLPITNAALKPRKRVAVSMGGEALMGSIKGSEGPLSPATRAKNMRPRKSILKSLSSRTLAQNENNTDMTLSHQYAHTIAFSAPVREEPEKNRRVSFAPNMHVRYLEFRGAEAPQPIMLPPNTFGPVPTGPRPSAGSHVRRSSIQNLALISNPVTFVGEGEEEGEGSMDLDTASESSSHEDEGVEMGGPRRFDGSDGRFSFGGGGVEGDEEDAEGEDDMDMTQVVYGGIARRSSMAASDADFDVEDESQIGVSDDEKTMDFTLAIGGVLPNAAPLSASTLRNSVGYKLPESPNSAGARLHPGQLMEGEVDMSMDETIAIGGIIEADASLSSGASGDDTIANRERTMTFSFNTRQHDDDGMDMTIAGGGIVGFPSMSPARLTHSQSTARSPASNPSRAAHGTPRFAQPTASSAQKSKTSEKRNVFAPSPSPFKSTPHKGGMDAAGDVAKRLSFGSTTSSGGRKRVWDEGDDAPSSPAKRGRASIAEEVFGAPPSTVGTGTPRRVLSPRKSPRKSISHRTSMPGKSPAKSPMLRRVLGLPIEGQGQDEQDEWDSPPTITLAAFLEMAGVQFMEGLPGLTRRRSSVAKGLLSSSTYGNGDRDFALHEYTTAQIQSVFLNMYTWAANKMKDDIREGQAQLDATETDCSVHNPPVIREYLSATDEDKQLFEMTFKAFKANTQLKARERWYDWKMGLMQRVGPDVEEMLKGMQEDKDRLDDMEEQVTTLLPELQERYAALQVELEKERQLVAELDQCDQTELAEYRAAISEQDKQIVGFSSELQDSAAQLEKLEVNLEDLRAKKAEAIAAIQVARSKCDQYTKSDVFRLQEEYTSLQSLHLWRPTRVTDDTLVFEYDAEIRLSFASNDYLPDFTSAEVELLPEEAGFDVGRARGPVEKKGPTEALFRVFQLAVRRLAKSKEKKMTSLFLQRVGQLWTAAQRVRQELRYVMLFYPTTYRFDESSRKAIASVRLMLPSAKSRVELEFMITPETLVDWPESAAGIEVGARTIYGNADAEVLIRAAKATVELACEDGYLGVLLQSCLDSASQYRD